MSSEKRLMQLRDSNMFTVGTSLKEYLQALCVRFARVFNEILPPTDYDYIVKRLEAKGIL